MNRLLSRILKNIHQPPLGRWGVLNRPEGIKYYDNCSGTSSHRDKIEFETMTRGCKFNANNSWCTKCYSFIPENLKHTEFYLEPYLHKSKCLLLK